jgi:hypothetical protein
LVTQLVGVAAGDRFAGEKAEGHWVSLSVG